MEMNEFRVGVITSPHGLRGEVKVYPVTEDPSRFLKMKEVILKANTGDTILHIQKARLQKNMVILQFKEYQHINEVENLRQKELYVTRDKAIPLQEDEYYVADLIGLEVWTKEGEFLGKLKEVLPTGANDVYVIGSTEGEILIPAIKSCIIEVNLKDNKMIVHLMEGLR